MSGLGWWLGYSRPQCQQDQPHPAPIHPHCWLKLDGNRSAWHHQQAAQSPGLCIIGSTLQTSSVAAVMAYCKGRTRPKSTNYTTVQNDSNEPVSELTAHNTALNVFRSHVRGWFGQPPHHAIKTSVITIFTPGPILWPGTGSLPALFATANYA